MNIFNIIRENTDTLNPYYQAIFQLIDRCLWDFKYQSFVSREKLRKSKNKHFGKKCVILCNGPSILKHDFSVLENTHTIGLNKINLLFEKTGFRPSYIACVNRFVLEQNKKFFNSTSIPLYLDSSSAGYIKSRDNITYIHSTSRPGFARDVSMSIYQGYTVTFVALQLAFHLGFHKVTLIGADHYFHVNGRPNSVALSPEKDKNHFDDKYFPKGEKWNLPDILGSEVFYLLAKKFFHDDGREIFNSTIGGSLEIFERIDLDKFIFE